MNRTEIIEELIKGVADVSVIERLDRIEAKLGIILSALVVAQKDAGMLAGITDDTIRNMALRGDVDPLQADGSSRNYFTLKIY